MAIAGEVDREKGAVSKTEIILKFNLTRKLAETSGLFDFFFRPFVPTDA
jgi:hypothetical protein